MFWNTIYGRLFWESPLNALINSWNISFNWYNLQTNNIVTSKMTVDDYPQVDYEDYNLPRTDWMWFLSKFYRSRNIEISWYLKVDIESDLQTLIDTFKWQLSWTSWIFKYLVDWLYRQITATCVNLSLPKEHYNITLVPFTIQLKTLESYFYLSNNVSITDNWTNSPRTIQVNNTWSAVSLPQAYLTFSWVTSTTSVSLSLWNRSLTYTWTIASWDILLFDCLNKQVFLNWVLVEYSWTFTQLEIWVNSLVFTINWTFTCDYSIAYRKNFI